MLPAVLLELPLVAGEVEVLPLPACCVVVEVVVVVLGAAVPEAAGTPEEEVLPWTLPLLALLLGLQGVPLAPVVPLAPTPVVPLAPTHGDEDAGAELAVELLPVAPGVELVLPAMPPVELPVLVLPAVEGADELVEEGADELVELDRAGVELDDGAELALVDLP